MAGRDVSWTKRDVRDDEKKTDAEDAKDKGTGTRKKETTVRSDEETKRCSSAKRGRKRPLAVVDMSADQ